MIIDDETITLKQHLRRITLDPDLAPIVPGRKNRGRVPFKATHIAVKWFDGDKPRAIIVHGVYHHPTQGVVATERSYDLQAKCPRWIKDIFNG